MTKSKRIYLLSQSFKSILKSHSGLFDIKIASHSRDNRRWTAKIADIINEHYGFKVKEGLTEQVIKNSFNANQCCTQENAQLLCYWVIRKIFQQDATVNTIDARSLEIDSSLQDWFVTQLKESATTKSKKLPTIPSSDGNNPALSFNLNFQSIKNLEGIWRIYRFSSDGKSISRKWMEIKATSDKELVGDFYYWKEPKNVAGGSQEKVEEGTLGCTPVKIHYSSIGEEGDAQVWLSSKVDEVKEEDRFYFSGILSKVDYGKQNRAGNPDLIIRGFGTRSARIEEQNAILNSPFSMVKYAEDEEQKRQLKKLEKSDFATNINFHKKKKNKTLGSREATILEHLSIQPSRPSLRYANNQSLYYMPHPDGFEITTFKDGWTKLLGREKFKELKEVFLNNSTSPSYHDIKERLNKVDSIWIDKKDIGEVKEKKENSLRTALAALAGMAQWVSITANYDLRIASENSVKLSELYKESRQGDKKIKDENEIRNETRFNKQYFIFYAEDREQALFVFRLKIDGENNKIITRYHGEVKYARDHIFFNLQHFRYDPKKQKENQGKRKTPYPDFDQAYYKYSWSDFSKETEEALKNKKTKVPHLELLSSSIITVEDQNQEKHRQSYALRELLIRKDKIIGKLPEIASPFLSTNEFESLGEIQHLKEPKLDNRLRLAYSGHSGLSFNTHESSHFVKENRALFYQGEYWVILFLDTYAKTPTILLFELKMNEFGLVTYTKIDEGQKKEKEVQFEGWSELQKFKDDEDNCLTNILNLQLRKISKKESNKKNAIPSLIKDGIRVRFHLRPIDTSDKMGNIKNSHCFLGTYQDYNSLGTPCSTSCVLVKKDLLLTKENISGQLKSESIIISRNLDDPKIIRELDKVLHSNFRRFLNNLFVNKVEEEETLSENSQRLRSFCNGDIKESDGFLQTFAKERGDILLDF